MKTSLCNYSYWRLIVSALIRVFHNLHSVWRMIKCKTKKRFFIIKKLFHHISRFAVCCTLLQIMLMIPRKREKDEKFMKAVMQISFASWMEKLESQKAHSIVKARAPKKRWNEKWSGDGKRLNWCNFSFFRSQNISTLHNTVMKGLRVANETASTFFIYILFGYFS